MTQEDDAQGLQPNSRDSEPSGRPSSVPRHAAHLDNGASTSGTFLMGHSGDPDTTEVYLQAAASSRSHRAAHMDPKQGLEAQVDEMMDEIHGPTDASSNPSPSHRMRGSHVRRDSDSASSSNDAEVSAANQATTNAGSSEVASSLPGVSHFSANASGGVDAGDEVASAADAAGSTAGFAGAANPAANAANSDFTSDASASEAAGSDASSRPEAQSPFDVIPPTPSRSPHVVAAHPSSGGTYDPDTSQNPYDPDSAANGGKGGRRAKSGKPHRKHHVVAIVLGIVVAVIAAGAAYGLWYLNDINSRLSKNLDSNLSEELTTTEAGDPFYILLLGTDKDQERADGTEYGSSDSAYRSDSIMLVRIDPKNVKVTMVSIHRDTKVDLGQYGTQKINAAYSLGGASYATKVISEFAGVDISHYAEVDLDTFTSIVDDVGGITVDLPVDVYDPNYTGLDLKAGTQTLDGATAALLCRSRHAYDAYGDGDRYRAANQRIIITAIVKKVLESDPVTMASTISTMADSVTTDMSVTDILNLANQMKTLNVDTDITSGMEPTTSEYVNSTWYEIVDEDAWKTMMERVDQGLSPTEDSTDDALVTGVTASISSDGASSSDGSSGDTGNSSSDSASDGSN